MTMHSFGQGLRFALLEKAARKMVRHFLARIVSHEPNHERLQCLYGCGDVLYGTNG